MADIVAQLSNLTNARSVEDLWEMHTASMRGYGFDRVMYGATRYRTSSSLGDPQDWVLLSTQTPAYMAGFIDGGHYRNAPMLNWALANDGACSWRWMADLYRAGKLTPQEAHVVAFNQQMNVTAGYTISFRSVSARSKAAVALTAEPGFTQDAVDALWDEKGDEITLLNNVMYLKLISLPYSGDRQLTKRQREVLQWVGDGKTVQDIAVLLGLTAATVEKHLRLAREALDVETTAQAVLKAAFYNQMFVLDVQD